MASKVIAFKEKNWMHPRTDYRIWDHLCRALGAELQMIDTYEDIIIPEGYSVVVLDESGATSLSEFKHPENAVYIFGRTLQNEIQNMIDIKYDHVIKVENVADVPFFGSTTGGIVLYDRLVKSKK